MQTMWSHHYRLGDGPPQVFWPAGLDLMAQLAGLEPSGRWADWARSPFTSDSTTHVSVCRKPAAGGECPSGSPAR
jgi:hypothetical protein